MLREIGAADVPSLVLLNKVDRVDEAMQQRLRRTYGPDAILLSAHDATAVAALRETLIAFFDARMVEAEILVPYAKQGLVGRVYETARVIALEHDETGTRLRVRGLPEAVTKLQATFAR